jgi:hypothetical protein
MKNDFDTVNAGNFVTFFDKNSFFSKFREANPYFFLVGNSNKNWPRMWQGHFWP